MTIKLFQQDRYLKQTEALVLEVSKQGIVLDRTIFAPSAGGQVCDLGTINDLRVVDVEETDGIIYHVTEQDAPFKAGDLVKLYLDWDRRFEHMQNHCGEHILSGIIMREFGAENKGFHLGDDIVSLDIDLKDMTAEMLSKLEDLANETVYMGIPVGISMIDNREDAEKLPLRKGVKVDEDIMVVTIPDVDCVACCCPHPTSTAEVGVIKIIRTEKYKGLTRIYIKCGKRAFEDYRKKHDIVTALNRKYSAEDDTLLEKIKIQESKNNVLRSELNFMKNTFADIEAARLVMEIAGGSIQKEYENGTIDDLMRTAKKLMEKTDLPIVLSSLQVMSVLITHNGKSKLKCGQVVKEFAVGAGGKGGGSDTQARAIFSDVDIMRNFIKIIEAHVR